MPASGFKTQRHSHNKWNHDPAKNVIVECLGCRGLGRVIYYQRLAIHSQTIQLPTSVALLASAETDLSLAMS